LGYARDDDDDDDDEIKGTVIETSLRMQMNGTKEMPEANLN
jgi:hypothetical protein